MSLRVVVHIGLQKTGTSYLQSVLWSSRPALAAQGVSLVPGSKQAMFELMLVVRNRYRPGVDRPRGAGALDRLPGRLAQVGTPVALLTEESLAAATPDQVDRLGRALQPHRVELLVTVRDLARQLPSTWQQIVQTGGTLGFEEYVAAVAERRGRAAAKFWRNQGLLDVLDRWGRLAPPERIHVVTVPQAGADDGLLLARLCSVLAVDPASLHTGQVRSNVALGRAQAELLRRVNARLPQSARRRHRYGPTGKRLVAQQLLAPQRGDRIRLPLRHEPWCREQAALIVARLGAGAYDVVGDLGDLEPAAAAFTADEPSPVADAEVVDAAVAALARLVTRRRPRAAPSPPAPSVPLETAPLLVRGLRRVRPLSGGGRS